MDGRKSLGFAIFAIIALLGCFKLGVLEGRVTNDFLQLTRIMWERNIKNDYIEMCLDLHNALRQDHSTPFLKLNEELSAAAQMTAEAMVQDPNFQGLRFGSGRSDIPVMKFSQNVFNISDDWLAARPGFAILWAISGWYDPAAEYDYNNPTPSEFTRMIWKSSTDFGCALARNGTNTVIVANYAPPSEEIVTSENLQLFKENVLPDSTDSKKPIH